MRPTPRAFVLLGLWLASGVAASVVPSLLPVWGAFALVVVFASVFDIAFLLGDRPIAVLRDVSAALSVGHWQNVTLRLENPGAAKVRLEVFDGYPVEGMEPQGLPFVARLAGRGFQETTYQVRPHLRGAFRWSHVEVRRFGRLGLWMRRLRLPLESSTRVYPDFRQVAKFSMLAVDQRVSQMGVHVRRKRGEGSEFFQLREYRDGDSLRQVDWKATSRRRQLISREYREEQNQQVMLLLDCGRRMHARDSGLSHFDHVLNAALLLAHVALKEGDAVGMLSFSGSQRYVAPTKGAGTIHTLVNQLFDLETTHAPSDYAEAVSRLSARQRRRALVVFLTNLRDDDAQELPRLLAPLRRRHLVLVGSMREAALDEVSGRPVERFDDALRVASTAHYLDQRRVAHAALRKLGTPVLDVTPEKLPIALVNSYLDIKRSGQL